jgi:hypothetical protein
MFAGERIMRRTTSTNLSPSSEIVAVSRVGSTATTSGVWLNSSKSAWKFSSTRGKASLHVGEALHAAVGLAVHIPTRIPERPPKIVQIVRAGTRVVRRGIDLSCAQRRDTRAHLLSKLFARHSARTGLWREIGAQNRFGQTGATLVVQHDVALTGQTCLRDASDHSAEGADPGSSVQHHKRRLAGCFPRAQDGNRESNRRTDLRPVLRHDQVVTVDAIVLRPRAPLEWAFRWLEPRALGQPFVLSSNWLL